MWNGEQIYTDEESEQGLIASMSRGAYDAAEAAIRADLFAYPDANVRERGTLSEACRCVSRPASTRARWSRASQWTVGWMPDSFTR